MQTNTIERDRERMPEKTTEQGNKLIKSEYDNHLCALTVPYEVNRGTDGKVLPLICLCWLYGRNTEREIILPPLYSIM